MSEAIYSSGEIESLKSALGADQDGTGFLGIAKATYDFAVHGGTAGAIGLGVYIPDNAIIWDGCADIITAFVSTGGAGTVALHLQSANDLINAVDADTLSGVEALVVDGTAANAFKLTAKRELTLTIASQNMTAGKATFFIHYMLSD